MTSIDRLTKRLTYANVTATLALFLALGGIAAAGTLISGSTIMARSLPANRLKRHSLTAAEIRIPPDKSRQNFAEAVVVPARRLIRRDTECGLPVVVPVVWEGGRVICVV